MSAKGRDCHVMWPQLFSPCLDCSLEAQPKYVRGGKRYGRRSLPEFQESVEEFAEVTVIEPPDEEARPSHIPTGDRSEVRNQKGTSLWTAGYLHLCGAERRTEGGLWLFSVARYLLILLLAFWIHIANLFYCLNVLVFVSTLGELTFLCMIYGFGFSYFQIIWGLPLLALLRNRSLLDGPVIFSCVKS